MLLFGDRIAKTHLLEISNIPIYSDGEMRQVVAFAARVDITSYCNDGSLRGYMPAD
ncbi:hypothetical protein AGR7B_pAt0151 [Agrobacterium deltaense RV3]|nr:hypothetical protein AGR7B_pAt0151 [Agrobacterium deltaense RV3]